MLWNQDAWTLGMCSEPGTKYSTNTDFVICRFWENCEDENS